MDTLLNKQRADQLKWLAQKNANSTGKTWYYCEIIDRCGKLKTKHVRSLPIEVLSIPFYPKRKKE